MVKKEVKKSKKKNKVQQKPTNLRGMKPLQVKFITSYLVNNGNISKACEECNINRSTYYDWMKLEPFIQAFNDANESFNDVAFEKIREWIDRGDRGMLQFWAKNRMNQVFQEKQVIEHQGSVSMDLLDSLSNTYDDIQSKRKDEGSPKK